MRKVGRPRLRRWATAALLLLLLALSTITSVDRYAEREYEALFQRAFITFALARTLNGLISAVQGTELALQPAGVGITLTPGEVLDPVNDLVERFSWIMLGATISLGIQQVLLDVGQWWGLRVLVAALGLAWLWLRLRRATAAGDEEAVGGAAGFERTLFQVFVVVLFLRFAVPLAVIANEALYHLFLEGRYQQSQQVIESAGADLEQASAQTPDAAAEADAEAPGLMESLGRSLSGTRNALDFRQRLENIRERAGGVIEHLIQLSVVFVLQTALLPIAFLWIFLQLAKQVFRQTFGNRH
ncbi:MAG: hypothetical protein EHM68_03625 [Lysobacterales bacterium]|nr:MAG: hypothetical protein EHM68_03625 [Xanthomonadales bacterium]